MTKKILSYGALVLGVLVGSQGFAKEMSCFPSAQAKGGAPARGCSLEVSVNLDKGLATARWNGQRVTAEIDQDNDNMAEFEFAPAASGGIWQHENEDGKKVWVGMMMPSEESGICPVKCVEY